MSLESKLGITDKIDNVLTAAAGKVGDMYQTVTGKSQESLLKVSSLVAPATLLGFGAVYLAFAPVPLNFIAGCGAILYGAKESVDTMRYNKRYAGNTLHVGYIGSKGKRLKNVVTAIGMGIGILLIKDWAPDYTSRGLGIWACGFLGDAFTGYLANAPRRSETPISLP